MCIHVSKYIQTFARLVTPPTHSNQGQATGGRGQHELSDAEHHGDGAGREGDPGGAGVHPGEHDPLPHPARHAQERANVSTQGGREPGDFGRRRKVCHVASSE